jgi:hypothetical protein
MKIEESFCRVLQTRHELVRAFSRPDCARAQVLRKPAMDQKHGLSQALCAKWSRQLVLRMSVFSLTFLLFFVPLIGNRAIAQSADLAHGQTQHEVQFGQVTDAPAVLDAPAGINAHQQGAASNTFAVEDKKNFSNDGVAQCLRDLGVMDCILTYGFRAIEFHAIGEEVIARFQRLDGTVNDEDVIVMSSHLEDAALNDRINLEESPVIFAQFQRLSGARYEIPKTANEVKRSLGFSEETPIAPVDWLEILKVHLERTLSTTPTVSDLILDLLGVELNPVVIEAN